MDASSATEFNTLNFREIGKIRDARVIAEWTEGARAADLAEKYGVTVAWVHTIARASGAVRRAVPERKRHQSWRAERNAQILADYDSGLSLESVGQKHGITRERVRQILAKNGHFDRHQGYNEPRKIVVREKVAALDAKREEKRRIRKERDDKICQLYRDGFTYKQIAAAMGRNENYIGVIQGVVRDAGIMNRRPDDIGVPRGKLTPEQKQEIANRYASGENAAAIAAAFGIVPPHVARVALKLGAVRPKVRVNSRAA